MFRGSIYYDVYRALFLYATNIQKSMTNKIRILHISANTNSHSKNYNERHIKQISDIIDCDSIYLDDTTFPPRINSLHSRLQAKIPKMLAFELYPEYDYYLWTDANITLKTTSTVEDFYNLCRNKDMVLFKHNSREFLHEEFSFMFDNKDVPYLQERYLNESIEEQYLVYSKSCNIFNEIPLYALGCFMYKNNDIIHKLMRDWYYHNARYSIQDQLSFPYLLNNFDVSVETICECITDNSYITYWGY